MTELVHLQSIFSFILFIVSLTESLIFLTSGYKLSNLDVSKKLFDLPPAKISACSSNETHVSKNKIEFSKTNDCWMSYQTLAATSDSAIFNPVVNEESNPEHPEPTPESTDTESPEE